MPAASHGGGLTKDAQVVAGRRTTAFDHECEIASGKLAGLERPYDLESRRIAEAPQNALRVASRSRRKHARPRFRDRGAIDDPVNGYGGLRLVSSCVKIALRNRIRQRARVTQILVIDDDHAIGDLIRDVLREEGHEIAFVEHLERAAPGLAPDLVITDLVDIHGYDTDVARAVLTRVHERYPGVPIIVCTGHEQALRESAQLGAVAVVRKPFTLEALVKTVADAIGR